MTQHRGIPTTYGVPQFSCAVHFTVRSRLNINEMKTGTLHSPTPRPLTSSTEIHTRSFF